MNKILSIATLFVLMVPPSIIWSQDCTADDGTEGVELWGEYYSIENTTELNLSGSGLTGPLPIEIGNLTNLEGLVLSGNQLTEEIPLEIGNLTKSIGANISRIAVMFDRTNVEIDFGHPFFTLHSEKIES